MACGVSNAMQTSNHDLPALIPRQMSGSRPKRGLLPNQSGGDRRGEKVSGVRAALFPLILLLPLVYGLLAVARADFWLAKFAENLPCIVFRWFRAVHMLADNVYRLMLPRA